MKVAFSGSGLLLFLSTWILLIGCEKEPFNPEFEAGPIQDCHNHVDWNEEKLENALMGSWTWVYHICPWKGGRNDTIDLGKVMTFDADKTLQIVKDGQSVYSGSWAIVKNELGGVQCLLHTEPHTHDVAGSFAVCNGQLYFGGIGEGCESFYKQK